MDIGQKIKKYRKLNKLTQKELGEKIGKNERSIRGYEAGNVIPPFKVIKRIVEVLDIRMIDLVGSDERLIEYAIKDLQETSENNEKEAISKLHESILDIIEPVNYLDCGRIDLYDILSNTDILADTVALVRSLISNRIHYYNDNYDKLKIKK